MDKTVRIILGPNGSGKSTLKRLLTLNHKINFGWFINADDIQRELNQNAKMQLPTTLTVEELGFNQKELISFLSNHSLNSIYSLRPFCASLRVENNQMHTQSHVVTSYEAAALADFLRHHAMKVGMRFSYETVFSDPSKIAFIRKLKKAGYRIYFYVVSTLNSEINQNRVKNRVKHHGHSVPEDKITSRYHRSLANIGKALQFVNRSFIIDNSQDFAPTLIAEIDEKKVIVINKQYQPDWAQKLLKKAPR